MSRKSQDSELLERVVRLFSMHPFKIDNGFYQNLYGCGAAVSVVRRADYREFSVTVFRPDSTIAGVLIFAENERLVHRLLCG